MLRRDIAAVVFSCDEGDLSRFLVETGPCVALHEGGRPLASPLTQHGGETPELTAALHVALTGGRPKNSLLLLDQVGGGRLSQLSGAFVEAMAASSEESLRLADEDEARGEDSLPSFMEHQRRVSEAWLRAGRWPREVVGLQNRLVRLGTARTALAEGQRVLVWHGPPAPQFVVTSGRGPYPPTP
ncbi:hypothetical protein [Nocardioides sp. WS12]|uniref:hypothetical protein n=1 Tax=Nocardioides sp. WS12 TaxID=2486272 RepID=UPI0015FAB3D2|nr:hypothetical protein [Nocardioides sp. WS12]